MKRFWKYLLWTLVILLLVVAVVLYIVPYYLKQREIQAAQADLALLSIQSTPSPSLKNGIDALWLLEFRTKNDADRADLMKRFGSDIQSNNNQDVLKQNQELQGRRIAELNLYNESLECSERMAECLNAIRADLPKYSGLNLNQDKATKPKTVQIVRQGEATPYWFEVNPLYKAEVEKNAALLANMDGLADYDIFVPREWSGDDDSLAIPFAKFPWVAAYGSKAAAVDWAAGKENEAWQRVCRNIKIGRNMLHHAPGMIYVETGTEAIRRNTDLAAQMLYEKPEWANRLPAECDGMFEPLTAKEQSICSAISSEFRVIGNDMRKRENGPFDLIQGQFRELINSGMGTEDIRSIIPLIRPNLDSAHTQALYAPHFATFCKPETTVTLDADRKMQSGLALRPDSFKHKWACVDNSVGCLQAAIMVPDYVDYVHDLQDTAMQQHAFQAALELYRLPAGKRRAALESVLAKHSSPSRRLRWNEEQKTVNFETYQQNASPMPLKLNLEN